MAGAQIWGLGGGVIQPEPDFTADQDESGAWLASASYRIARSDFSSNELRNKFVRGATPRSLDPTVNSYWDFLGLTRAAVIQRKGGYIRMRAFFAGFSSSEGGGAAPTATASSYRLRGQTGRANIMEHPEVVALTAEQRSLIRELLDGSYDYSYDGVTIVYRDPADGDVLKSLVNQPTGKALVWSLKVLHGLTTYLRASYTWSCSWTDSAGLTAAQLNLLGKVDPNPEGAPKKAGGTRDWLLSSADQFERGGVFENHLEWTLSERGGWDSDMYDY